MNTNVHAQHRQRMRDRFLSQGLEGFQEHQILEMLLFYSIPRIDTNVIAHRLIDRFGSLRGVLDADYKDLITVDGVGDSSACLIKFIAATSRSYLLSEAKSNDSYDTAEKIGNYLIPLFMNCSVEKTYILLFNGKLELLDTIFICEGSINSTSFSPKAVVESVISHKAAGFVMAHNHPSGLAIPSSNDIELTTQINYICEHLDINFLEHFVVAGNKYTPIPGKKFILAQGNISSLTD